MATFKDKWGKTYKMRLPKGWKKVGNRALSPRQILAKKRRAKAKRKKRDIFDF